MSSEQLAGQCQQVKETIIKEDLTQRSRRRRGILINNPLHFYIPSELTVI